MTTAANRDEMRTNGWAAPFHCLQVITWVFFPSVMGMFFAFTTPLLEISAAYMASIAYGVVCLVVIYAVVRCTATDPSDDSILQRAAGAEGAHQHTQVGEDQLYCNVCVQYVYVFYHGATSRFLLRKIIRFVFLLL